jgi:hypothetical protein
VKQTGKLGAPGVRPFTDLDWLDAWVKCDHCGQTLQCVGVAPLPPENGQRMWKLALSDGGWCRMLEDGIGIRE